MQAPSRLIAVFSILVFKACERHMLDSGLGALMVHVENPGDALQVLSGLVAEVMTRRGMAGLAYPKNLHCRRTYVS